MGAPQGIEIAPANEFHEFKSLDPSAASIFCENLVIPQFPVHGPGCLDSYNFLVSQRLTVILARDLLGARADQTISKLVTNTRFTVTKIMVKVRKHTDRTTAFRRAIAPADDITLRCNHSTNHVKSSLGRRKALKSRQRAILVNLDA